MKILSIILPVFNGLEFTRKCISNLRKAIQRASSAEYDVNIVVVDDGSKDGTADWITGQQDKKLHLLKGDGNLWWSGGVNVGVKYSIDHLKSDYLLLWNNDITAADNYFVELFSILKKQPENVIVGSKIFTDSELQTVWSMGGVFNPYSGKKYMLGYFKKDVGQYEKPEIVDWLPGMGSIIPVSVIGKIGLWDAINFPQYHGDSDFTYRAKMEGYKIMVYPSLKIWNDVTNTGIKHKLSFKKLYSQLFDIKSNYNLQKNMLFYRKYAKSYKAYFPLVTSYSKLLGGFLKWKLLSLFNVRKNAL